MWSGAAAGEGGEFEEEDLIAMITEINVIRGFKSWWLDTSASHHVCHDLSLFKKYNETKDKNILLGITT